MWGTVKATKCIFCRHFGSTTNFSPARNVTFLFSRAHDKPPYKTAVNVSFILENEKEFRKSIEARELNPVDFEALKKLYNDYVRWDKKENDLLMKLSEARKKSVSDDENEVEMLTTLSKVYKDKVVSLDRKIHEVLSTIPNLVNHEVTPDKEVKVLETYPVEGLPCAGMGKVKSHEVIGEVLGILRQRTLEGVTNSKGFYLMGAGCYLERALIRYTEDFIAQSSSRFVPLTVPLMLSPKVIEGCGQQVREDRTQVFRLSREFLYMSEPLYLAGTSEHALIGYLMRCNIARKVLPLRLTATSPCFRAELTEGRHSRGIYRVPQFNKVEMVGLGLDASSAEDLFEEFVSLQRKLFKSLQIPFRVVEIPANDLGLPAYRKIDMEAYMPGRGEWGEISSCSNCTTYQSERLHIRSDGCFVHTVNGTACATPRLLIAILENYQQKDKSVQVPAVLRPYMPEFCRESITLESDLGKIGTIRPSKISFTKSVHKLKKEATPRDSTCFES